MRLTTIVSAVTVALSATPGFAQGLEKWRVGGGVQFERSASDSGNVRSYQLNLGNISRGTVSAEYRPNDLLGLGADIGLPATLAIKSELGSEVIDFKTSSITVMGRYYPRVHKNIRPFVGLGATYSRYTKETLYGWFPRYDLQIDNDLSPAVALGIEVPHREKGMIRTELSYNRAEADISFGPDNPVEVGRIRLNPVKINVSYLMSF